MLFQKCEKIRVLKGMPIRAEALPDAAFDLCGRGDSGNGCGLHKESRVAERKVRVS